MTLAEALYEYVAAVVDSVVDDHETQDLRKKREAVYESARAEIRAERNACLAIVAEHLRVIESVRAKAKVGLEYEIELSVRKTELESVAEEIRARNA